MKLVEKKKRTQEKKLKIGDGKSQIFIEIEDQALDAWKKKLKESNGEYVKSWGYIVDKKWECVFYTWDWEREPFVCVSFDVDDEKEVREDI